MSFPRAGWLSLLLLLNGCISSELSVDIHTKVYADGSCQRRIEYRLERTAGDDSFRQSPDQDPLRRFFRLPSGPTWSVDEKVDDDLHVASAEAFLRSPNEIGSDYFRSRGPKGQPSRNSVSFGFDAEASRYEYLETVQDTNSPVLGALRIAEAAQKRDSAFGEALENALRGRVRRDDARKVFRDSFRPAVEGLRALSTRPLFGPREKRELEELLKKLDDEEGTKETLLPLAAGVGKDEMAEAFAHAQEVALEPVTHELEGGAPRSTPSK